MPRGATLSRTRAIVATCVALAVGAATVGTAGAQTSSGTTATDPTVVDIAVSNPDFSTLVSAVTAADLAGTLAGSGPFTVFAPTNEAFAKVPKSQLDALLADKEQLAKVLTYHVVAGKILAGDLKKKQKVETVEGNKVTIVKKKNGAKIGGAKIISTDIEGSNGVIHVIDTVLLPPAGK